MKEESTLLKDVQEHICVKYYEKQNFDFGDFPPDDENHYESIKDDFLNGIQHEQEMTPEDIIKLAIEKTLTIVFNKRGKKNE